MSEYSVIPQLNDEYQKVEVFLLLLDEKSQFIQINYEFWQKHGNNCRNNDWAFIEN